jgi:CBS domain-containing protein
MKRLGELMTGSIVAVAPEDTLGEAAERMAEDGVGSSVVLDSGRLIGILTERDLLRAVAGRVHTSEARVREWMTTDPVTATEDTSADEAIRTMLESGFRHLPVVEGGNLLGIVGIRDVLRGLVERLWREHDEEARRTARSLLARGTALPTESDAG